MRTLAVTAALATALAGTGCIVSTVEPTPPTGSVDVYWQFVRTAWDGSTFLYDPEASTPVGATGSCPESGVDQVEVSWPGGGPIVVDCRRGGYQGMALDGVVAGRQLFTVTGYRGTRAVFSSSQYVDVLAGPPSSVVSATVDVYGVYADLDVFFEFADGLGVIPGATCLSEGVDYFTFDVYDGVGTVVASTTMFGNQRLDCVDVAPGPGVALDAMDLDDLTIRARAWRIGTAAPIYDSCDTVANTSAAFPHYGTDTGSASGWWVQVLYASCP
jgi:hypothetical protein